MPSPSLPTTTPKIVVFDLFVPNKTQKSNLNRSVVIVITILILIHAYMSIYIVFCAFHKHANSEAQKPPLQLRFSLPSIIIRIKSNEPLNKETNITDRNPPITNHKPWPFKPVEVNFCVFPKRSAELIDGSEKRKRKLALELQNSRVFESKQVTQLDHCMMRKHVLAF